MDILINICHFITVKEYKDIGWHTLICRMEKIINSASFMVFQNECNFNKTFNIEDIKIFVKIL